MIWHSIFWYWYSTAASPIMHAFLIYRFIYGKKTFEASFIDYAVSYAAIGGLIYYSAATFHILSEYPDISMCEIAFFCHHVATLWGCRAMLRLPYYPWFVIAPLANHCLLVTWP